MLEFLSAVAQHYDNSFDAAPVQVIDAETR